MSAELPRGWVRYWFLSEETRWPFRSIGIDAREVPAGGQVLVTAYTGWENGDNPPPLQFHADPDQLDRLAAQWIEFREATRVQVDSGNPAR